MNADTKTATLDETAGRLIQAYHRHAGWTQRKTKYLTPEDMVIRADLKGLRARVDTGALCDAVENHMKGLGL